MLEHHADPRAQLGQIGVRIADRDAVDVDVAFLKRLRPLTHLISVDLPEPDGPHTTTTSPRATSVLQRLSTWVGPYHLLTPAILIMGP